MSIPAPQAISDAAEIMDLEFSDDPNYQRLRDQERIKSQAAQAVKELSVTTFDPVIEAEDNKICRDELAHRQPASPLSSPSL